MNKKTIITILLALVAYTGYAQTSKDSLYVVGGIADGFTKAAIPDAYVTLMRADSTVVDTMHVYKSHNYTSGVGRSAGTTEYYFKMNREPKDYIVKVEHPNYETAYAPYTQK